MLFYKICSLLSFRVGKTLQIVAFVHSMFKADLIEHVLLVVPVTMVQRWFKEFNKFAPEVEVLIYGGKSKIKENEVS